MPYQLLAPDGQEYESTTPGTLGGHRRSRIYGRLNCPTALRAIARGGPYPKHRVFFVTEQDARAAGYRPCAKCLPEQYRTWREAEAKVPTASGQPQAVEAGDTPEE